ncbi:Uma2 family endonuclease [Saccharopolyspora rosea]|uniref:Uma2 family endonuclease n=1 Tax=Saccharopolyspora rosea TaxID=524884 RepID=A0ABW3FXW2_9PSEU|nr:Uma2 family endonuclease [Saccharopolyspora rosea]
MRTNANGRRFNVHDLAEMPDDGRRYELIDGELLVSLAPEWPHQEAVGELFVRLRQACTPKHRVLTAPFGVRHDIFNELRPDVLVARYADLTLENLPAPPVLAVEVSSASSLLKDASLKKAVYARLGVRHFWLVDPDLDVPTATAWDLVGGAEYQRVERAVGDEVFRTRNPFPVEFSPADLIAGLRPPA